VVFEQAKMAVDEGLSKVKHSKSSNHPISVLYYNDSSSYEIFIGFFRYGITRRGRVQRAYQKSCVIDSLLI
jgi:hypothetical protein